MSIVLDTSARDLSSARYAGFWVRVGAAVIDFLVLLPIAALTQYLLWYSPNFVLFTIVMLLGLLYKPVMEARYGATVGKMVTKLKVLKEDGTPLSMADAWMRYLPWIPATIVGIYVAYILFSIPGFDEVDGIMESAVFQMENADALGAWGTIQQLIGALPLISALFLLGNARKQAAHDMLADSVVIYRENETMTGLV